MSDIPRCPLCGLGTVIAEELRATGRWVYCQCCDGEYRDEITRLTVEVERLTAMHGGSQRALAKVIAENTAKQAVVEAADVVVEQWEGHMMESTKTVDLLPLVAAVQKYRALDGEP